MQRQSFPRRMTSSLCSRSNGRISRGEPAIARLQHRFEILEKLRSAVGERVGAQGAQGQRIDTPEPAPDRRLDGEQEVAARQINGLVGSLRAGTRRPPCSSAGRKRRGSAHRARRGFPVPVRNRGKKCPGRRQLDLFPAQSAADVEGMHPGILPQCVDSQDRAVESAADQDGNRGSFVDGHQQFEAWRVSAGRPSADVVRCLILGRPSTCDQPGRIRRWGCTRLVIGPRSPGKEVIDPLERLALALDAPLELGLADLLQDRGELAPGWRPWRTRSWPVSSGAG